MVELNAKEIDEVNGGIAPLIGVATAVYSHFTASTVTGAIVARVGLGAATYGFGTYLDNNS